MSLDFYLDAEDLDGNKVRVYEMNITHNLRFMADAAGVYMALWRPEERARYLIEPLRDGLDRLRAEPEIFDKYNPPNKWGNYKNLVNVVRDTLAACEQYPSAHVQTWK